MLLLQGNGFVTDPAIIKEYGIHDANPFFTTLLSKPYLDSVVISPHLYGPSVSNRKDFYKVQPTGTHSAARTGHLGPTQQRGLGLPRASRE